MELSIGHLKADHRRRRNFLEGPMDNAFNPILTEGQLQRLVADAVAPGVLALGITWCAGAAGSARLGCPPTPQASGGIAKFSERHSSE